VEAESEEAEEEEEEEVEDAVTTPDVEEWWVGGRSVCRWGGL